MQRDLFLALLSMDAYNRGLPSTRPGTIIPDHRSSNLGFASYFDESDEALNAIGFYAVAYTLPSGEKFISYRGTDQPGVDSATGYGGGSGHPTGPQATMAIESYKSGLLPTFRTIDAS